MDDGLSPQADLGRVQYFDRTAGESYHDDGDEVNRTTRKPGEQYTIWMTRKMPRSVLGRMRVLAAQTNRPLWTVHQLAVRLGMQFLERERGKP